MSDRILFVHAFFCLNANKYNLKQISICKGIWSLLTDEHENWSNESERCTNIQFFNLSISIVKAIYILWISDFIRPAPISSGFSF